MGGKLQNKPGGVVRARGLEPPILTEPDPKSGVSANSTTRATCLCRCCQLWGMRYGIAPLLRPWAGLKPAAMPTKLALHLVSPIRSSRSTASIGKANYRSVPQIMGHAPGLVSSAWPAEDSLAITREMGNPTAPAVCFGKPICGLKMWRPARASIRAPISARLA